MRAFRLFPMLAILGGLVSFAVPALAQEGSLKKVLDDIPTYQKYVEEIRGKKFEKDVDAAHQSNDDFRKFVERAMDEEIPPERLAGWSGSLKMLGLLPKSFELREGLVDFLATQAGAYYDPKSEAFYVVQGDLPEQAIRTVVVHELEHALQDQIFDLDTMTEAVKESKSSDVESALAFLVEGEATYVMTLDQYKQMGMPIDEGAQQAVEMTLSTVKKMDIAALTEMSATMMGDNATLKEAAAAMRTMPNFITRSFVDPYNWGAHAIAKVRGEKGWVGVEKLFRDPPRSTEQFLHPAKILKGDDPPVQVRVPEIGAALGPGWKEVYDDTLGEHGVLILLDEFLGEPKKKAEGGEEGLEGLAKLLGAGATPGEEAAAGWGGDRYALYEGDGGARALAWVTTWDRARDAAEFYESYRLALRKRFRSTTLADPMEGVFREVIGSDLETENVLAALRGKDVIILISPTHVQGTKVVDQLIKSRKAAW